jgi:NADPH:quinone reductase-like Zn-dependent oxidoreductase
VSDETACQLIAKPLSAKMLLADLGLKHGDWLVQNAGNGAVAKLVSQFGVEQDIRVLSLVRQDAALEDLFELGIITAVSIGGRAGRSGLGPFWAMRGSYGPYTSWAGTELPSLPK